MTDGADGHPMKAIVQDRYGAPDVLELCDVDPPEARDDEVLVRIRAASVNPLDWYQVTGTPYITRLGGGLRRPTQTIPGVDLSGQVEAVGASVTAFRVGDEVYGMRSGAFAEYVAANEARLARKPANLTYEQAAAVPTAGVTALQGLRDKGRIRSGQTVLPSYSTSPDLPSSERTRWLRRLRRLRTWAQVTPGQRSSSQSEFLEPIRPRRTVHRRR